MRYYVKMLEVLVTLGIFFSWMETDLLGERSRKYSLSNINEKLSLTFFSSTCVIFIYLTFKQI
jgi:hypothetical protein